MSQFRQIYVFLRPTGLAVLALALLAGLRFSPLGSSSSSSLDFIAGGTPPTEVLPLLSEGLVLPSPGIAPRDVVQTQLAGLADPAADGVGILQCYSFASPANRTVTGPLDRFGRMVRQGDFACFARPRAVLVGRPEFRGPVARILVTVIDQRQKMHAFNFILAKQTHAPFENCWMTEAVFPVAGAQDSPTPNPDPPRKSV